MVAARDYGLVAKTVYDYHGKLADVVTRPADVVIRREAVTSFPALVGHPERSGPNRQGTTRRQQCCGRAGQRRPSQNATDFLVSVAPYIKVLVRMQPGNAGGYVVGPSDPLYTEVVTPRVLDAPILKTGGTGGVFYGVLAEPMVTEAPDNMSEEMSEDM